jgi:hypothetical protein
MVPADQDDLTGLGRKLLEAADQILRERIGPWQRKVRNWGAGSPEAKRAAWNLSRSLTLLIYFRSQSQMESDREWTELSSGNPDVSKAITKLSDVARNAEMEAKRYALTSAKPLDPGPLEQHCKAFEAAIEELRKAVEASSKSRSPDQSPKRRQGQALTPEEEKRYKKVLAMRDKLQCGKGRRGITEELIQACAREGIILDKDEAERIRKWGVRRHQS